MGFYSDFRFQSELPEKWIATSLQEGERCGAGLRASYRRGWIATAMDRAGNQAFSWSQSQLSERVDCHCDTAHA